MGNILGAIVPAIELANDPSNESFLFIADLHSLTQIKDGNKLRDNTYAVAAAWLAFGLDPEKTVFYRQSDIRCARNRVEGVFRFHRAFLQYLQQFGFCVRAFRLRNLHQNSLSGNGIRYKNYKFAFFNI